MTLKGRVESDIKSALLGGDRFKAEVLRVLKSAILNEEVAKNQREAGLDDQAVEQVVAREIKKRQESVALYSQNDRSDLAESEQREVDILSHYLPVQIGESELQKVIDEAVARLGASGVQDMGKVIGAVKSEVGNTASGAMIADQVKKTLI